MPLLNRFRKAANRVLSPLGLAIERVDKQPWFGSPVVDVQVGRFIVQMPVNSPLPSVYKQNPDYTRFLGRLARLVSKKYPQTAALDIGANVGDTASIIKSAADIPILCIEGDDFIFALLEKNIRQFMNTTACKLFLGERTETVSVGLEKSGWNTTLVPNHAGTGREIKIVSLDDFLAKQPNPAALKLVKIDTEGFDCSIIRGAKNFIRETHPVISFEYNRDNMRALGEKGLDTLALLKLLGYSSVVLHDCNGWFFDAGSLIDDQFISNIHDYADGKNAAVYYFDLTLFHELDKDVGEAFAEGERVQRSGQSR